MIFSLSYSGYDKLDSALDEARWDAMSVVAGMALETSKQGSLAQAESRRQICSTLGRIIVLVVSASAAQETRNQY